MEFDHLIYFEFHEQKEEQGRIKVCDTYMKIWKEKLEQGNSQKITYIAMPILFRFCSPTSEQREREREGGRKMDAEGARYFRGSAFGIR